GLEDVHARVAGPRAVIGRVVVARAGLRIARAAPRARLEHVARTRPARAGTGLRHVALAGRGAAREGARLEDVHARITGPRAVIGRIVVARAALRAGRATRRARIELVGWTVSARPG